MADYRTDCCRQNSRDYNLFRGKGLVISLNAKETRFFAKDGLVMETREVEALDVQLRALDAWAKMYGAFREDKIQVDVNHS
jgi:hypothetical protein